MQASDWSGGKYRGKERDTACLISSLLKPQTILEEVQSVIGSSTIFPKIRHVFIATDWLQMDGVPGKIFEMLKPAGIKVAMEGRGDCQTSFPYNTNYAEYMSMRSANGWRMPNPGMSLVESFKNIQFTN